jgi:SRSO17 transposase
MFKMATTPTLNSEPRPMLTIDEIPCGLKPFFDAGLTGGGLSKPQYAHFWPTFLAFAVSFRGRNVQELHACIQDEACRQQLNDFLTESPWEGPRVLAAACLFAFALLKLKPGEELFVVLDGTQKLKRGKKIEALGKVKDATRQYPAPGHRYLIVYLRVRGIRLPGSVSLYLPKQWLASAEGKAHAARTGATFKTLNALAAEVIAARPSSSRRQ